MPDMDRIRADNAAALISAGNNAEAMAQFIEALYQLNLEFLITNDPTVLISAGPNIMDIIKVFGILYRGNPRFITSENFTNLVNSGSNAKFVAEGLETLFKANPGVVSNENFNALISAGPNAQFVESVLSILDYANPGLITNDNFTALINVGPNAEFVARALGVLGSTKRELVTQNNFITLINVGSNAESVALGIKVLNEENFDLLNEENRAALISAGPNAESVARGFIALSRETLEFLNDADNRANLISAGPNAEAMAKGIKILFQAKPELLNADNRAALISAGPNAEAMARGLGILFQAKPELLTADNRAALISAGNNAEAMAQFVEALYQLNLEFLITNDPTVLISAGPNIMDVIKVFRILIQANPSFINNENFTALVNVGSNAEFVESVLSILDYANPGLITNDNFTALINAGPNAEFVARAFGTLGSTSRALVTQNNFTALISADFNVESVAMGLKILFKENTDLLSEENRAAILSAGPNAASVARGLVVLYRANPELINDADNRADLISAGPNAEVLAKFLLDNKTLNETISNLRASSLISEDQVLAYEAISPKLYFRINNNLNKLKASGLSSLSTLKKLLSLPPEQVALLGSSKDVLGLQTKSDLPLALTAVDLAFQFKKLEKIALRDEDAPKANDLESSMDKKRVEKSNQRYEGLKKHFPEAAKVNIDDLTVIEKEFRLKLLADIKTSAQKPPASENNTAIVNFLNSLSSEQLESLAAKDPVLMEQARNLFTETNDINQTAWRAYDNRATCVAWPNLLALDPKLATSTEEVFATSESTAGMEDEPKTLGGYSLRARKYMALCWEASKENPEVWEDLKAVIAEIRRAHNTDTKAGRNETDNPSCFPGTIGRLAQAVNKHKLFIKDTIDIESVIKNKVRVLLNNHLSALLAAEPSPEEKTELFDGVLLLGLDNAMKAIDDPDAATGHFNAKATLDRIVATQEKRANFLAKLSVEEIYSLVAIYLSEKKIPVSDKTTIEYFVKKSILDLRGTGVDLSKEQRESLLTDTELAEQKKAEELKIQADAELAAQASKIINPFAKEMIVLKQKIDNPGTANFFRKVILGQLKTTEIRSPWFEQWAPKLLKITEKAYKDLPVEDRVTIVENTLKNSIKQIAIIEPESSELSGDRMLTALGSYILELKDKAPNTEVKAEIVIVEKLQEKLEKTLKMKDGGSHISTSLLFDDPRHKKAAAKETLDPASDLSSPLNSPRRNDLK